MGKVYRFKCETGVYGEETPKAHVPPETRPEPPSATYVLVCGAGVGEEVGNPVPIVHHKPGGLGRGD